MSEKKQKQIMIDLSKAESYFRGGGMTIINKNFHFLLDKNFMEINKSLASDDKEEKRIWKNHIFCNFFDNGLHIEGDLVECGVYKGFSCAVACNYLNFERYKNKKLFLFDTWDGIPDDQLDDIRKKYPEMNNKYKSEENLALVNERFKKFPNVIKVKGKIPESFKSISLPDKISFLHLDLNTHIGEILALEKLFSRMSKGAICLLDDFGETIGKEQMIHEKKWFLERNHYVCEIPTGQAFVIKH
tara:strand:- start:108 stop:839 length:732 start_codon:yes stop_codon:yes gene_type:complete